jgi:hypothetical protein
MGVGTVAVASNLVRRLKDVSVEAAVLASALVGIVALSIGRGAHVELAVAFWALLAAAAATAANLLTRHRLWVAPFAASLVALVAPLACLERLNDAEVGGALVGGALLGTIVVSASAAALCLLASLVSGRLSA